MKKELTVQTRTKKEVVDLTDEINGKLAAMKAGDGIAVVQVMHTTCSLAMADLDPGTDRDYLEAIGKMVDTAAAAGPDRQSQEDYQLLKGLAEYRCGDFAGAVAGVRELTGQVDDSNRAVQACAVLAMAQYRLGEDADARAALARGAGMADKLANRTGPDWNESMLSQLLINEAKALILSDPHVRPDAK